MAFVSNLRATLQVRLLGALLAGRPSRPSAFKSRRQISPTAADPSSQTFRSHSWPAGSAQDRRLAPLVSLLPHSTQRPQPARSAHPHSNMGCSDNPSCTSGGAAAPSLRGGSMLLQLLLLLLLLLVAAGEPGAAYPQRKHFIFASHLGRSHMTPTLGLLEPLAARGHAVTIVTDRRGAEWIAPAYPAFRIHLVHFVMPVISNTRRRDVPAEDPTLFVYKRQVEAMREVLGAAGSGAGNTSSASGRPDLLLCDLMMDGCADIANETGTPYGVTMNGLTGGVGDAPYVVGWLSPFVTPTTETLSLAQRLQLKFLHPLQLRREIARPLAQLAALRARLGVTVRADNLATRHAHALKLISTFFGFETPRPLDPTVMMFGPVRTVLPGEEVLPAAVGDWLVALPAAPRADGASNGATAVPRVAYVAFGTHVDVPGAVLGSLLAGLLAALDARLLDGAVFANIGRERLPGRLQADSRFLVLQFAPQKALLAHPAVVLFVSHGGSESSHEAMHEAKPMLVVPFFGDQPINSAKLAAAGMAEALPLSRATPAAVSALLARMLGPGYDSYATAARRMQALSRAHSRHSVAAGADMLEYYAHYGWQQLQPASSRMPWWKATDADLWVVAAGAALALLGLLAAAAHALLRACVSRLRGSSSCDGGEAAAKWVRPHSSDAMRSASSLSRMQGDGSGKGSHAAARPPTPPVTSEAAKPKAA